MKYWFAARDMEFKNGREWVYGVQLFLKLPHSVEQRNPAYYFSTTYDISLSTDTML